MEKKTYTFEYQKFNSSQELSEPNKQLIDSAKEAAGKAHAPYSNFRVGAALLLENGEIFTGNNQENASYPVGICAERTLLSYVHANFPNLKKIKIAISVLDTDKEVSPCGMCRQTLLEYESLQNQSIEMILHNASGTVLVVSSSAALLPLHFDMQSLS